MVEKASKRPRADVVDLDPISLLKPCCRVRYDLDELNHPDLTDVVSLFLRNKRIG